MMATRGRSSVGAALVVAVVLIVGFISLSNFLALPSPAGDLVSAPVELQVNRESGGQWVVTVDVTITTDAVDVIRSVAGQWDPASASATAAGVVAQAGKTGWIQVGTLDAQPVLEQVTYVTDPGDFWSGVWTADTHISPGLPRVYDMRIIPDDGSTATVIAPRRLLIQTAPGGEVSDQLDGTERWVLPLDGYHPGVVLRVAPGWARHPGTADTLKFLIGNPIGTIIGLVAGAIAMALIGSGIKRAGAWLASRLGRGGVPPTVSP